MSETRPFVCSSGALWLPRVLAGSLLAAALIVAMAVDPEGLSVFSRPFRIALVLVAAVGSLWIVRRGAEVRVQVAVGDERIEFRHGRRSRSLPYVEIDRIEYAAAFGSSRNWLSALVLTDRFGQGWRIPALIGGGGSMVREIVRRAGRSDLEAWAGARGLERKMSHSGRLQLLGYVVSAALPVAALVYARGA